jgi:arylsulfatase
MGDWKAIRTNLLPKDQQARSTLSLELYNLAADPAERHNVAAANPPLVAEIEAILRREHTPSAEFPLKALDEL